MVITAPGKENNEKRLRDRFRSMTSDGEIIAMVQIPEDAESSAAVTDLSAVRDARKQSAAVQQRVTNRRFNGLKVARLKREIERGDYRIDPFSTADRFIEHERNGP